MARVLPSGPKSPELRSMRNSDCAMRVALTLTVPLPFTLMSSTTPRAASVRPISTAPLRTITSLSAKRSSFVDHSSSFSLKEP